MIGALALLGAGVIFACIAGEWFRRQWINDPAGRDRNAWLAAIKRAEAEDQGSEPRWAESPQESCHHLRQGRGRHGKTVEGGDPS